MDATHLHLMVSHLPIFGSFLGGIVLAYAIFANSSPIKIAAYIVLIISSFGTAIPYFSGEEAEEKIEHLAGVSENIIENHAHFAQFAAASLLILGIIAVIGLFLTRKESPLNRPIAIVALIAALVSFGLVAQTGYLGGQIRHSEIRSGADAQTLPIELQEEDKDDD
jgi:uncharacterized membrane protein